MVFFRRPKQAPSPLVSKLPNLKQINTEAIPVLSASQLIGLLKLEPVIRSIKQLSSVSDRQFNHLYQPVIDRFLESAQLVPASTSHHHAGLGGLIVHTLNVVERSLKRRKRYELPINAEPEIIAEHEHAWTYGVFVGAMLHDVGKLVSNYRLKLDNQVAWNPHGSGILETGAKTYRIEFIQSDYRLHVRLGPTFLHLMPEAGRQWLAQRTDLLAQLIAWLQGDLYECGPIGEIVMDADRASVADNLKLGGDRDRLPSAPSVPMIDRLMTALRQLLENGDIRVNQSGGGAGWVDGNYTWLACAVIAQKVLHQLQSSGAKDIPTDNTRLYDIWQEHGYAVPAPNGKAVWHVQVKGPENNKGKPAYSYALTMLKFETGRLFHPSRRPQPFGGAIEVLEEGVIVEDSLPQAEAPSEIGQKTAPVQNTNQSQKADTAGSSESFDEDDPFAPNNMPGVSNETETETDVSQQKSEADASESGAVADDNSDELASRPKDRPKGLLDPNVGEHFINWIRRQIEGKALLVNRPEAKVHVVKEGVLLVTPSIFQYYVKTFDLIESGMTLTQAFKKAQQRVAKLNLHIKAPNRMNVHTYLVKGSEKESTICGFLFPHALFYDGDPPDPNRHLINPADAAVNDNDESGDNQT